ncbi:hypothetical protein ACJMK2_008693 [Sinanodonta woodiana]|uniref:Uncharacterized protein n=1 Tax=Sinanodonta woodiana TaxID=1069815 RepID=A0ABD3VMX5_SINWO
MAQGDPRKWHMPGWRIEQKFGQGVLIGNWSEDRYTFLRGDHKNNSTHRTDFRNFGNHRPDVIVRRKAVLKNDGYGPEYLFYHHGNRYANNKISWYDEHYNGRWKENSLPPTREWNGNRLAWGPEKSDYPLQGPPTNFGLIQTLKSRWAKQIADEARGDYLSTYQTSFYEHPKEAMTTERHAVPKENSTSLHPVNKVNKDLHFRNMPLIKAPEKFPSMAQVAV